MSNLEIANVLNIRTGCNVNTLSMVDIELDTQWLRFHVTMFDNLGAVRREIYKRHTVPENLKFDLQSWVE